MSSKDIQYFILTESPTSYGLAKAGRICYIRDHTFRAELRKCDSPSKLPVMILGSQSCLDYSIEVNIMTPVSAEEAGLLLALSEDAERLKWFSEGTALQEARGLTKGSQVIVQEGREELRGIVRYIGPQKKPVMDHLAGTVFGIQLQGTDRRKGNTTHSYHYDTRYSLPKDCDIVVPFTRVRALTPSSSSSSSSSSSILEPHSSPQLQPEQLQVGDRVTYFSDTCCHGMVLGMEGDVVLISTDKDENGKRGGEVRVPLENVVKGEVPAEAESMDTDAPGELNSDLYQDLSLNSMVELTLAAGNAYGIIRWIGVLNDRFMAGLELEEELGVSDGTFKEKRYFTCPPRKALFVKLSSLRPDSRFQANHSQTTVEQKAAETGTERSTGRLETAPPISTEQVKQTLIGRMKGIQGHCNSCYMDAALFSLFSCSSVLDSMLFKLTSPHDAPVQNTLLHDIVNPLRSQGFVEGRHVMKLRQQLQELGHSRSFTTDEKDPEEFLMVIMHHILALDPLLKLSAHGKVQESYCYQIFLDQNHSLVLPTVQQLLEHSFHSGALTLAEVPSCLILQMPRFGKKFKMFEKIIPSLELDITDLLSEGPQQCILCGLLAQFSCSDCFSDSVFSQTGFKVFCSDCSEKVHSHPQRRSHQPSPLVVPPGYLDHCHSHTQMSRDKLELFAVLCIETSHYVSFVRYGPEPHHWLFFDSMADRQGERDGFNIPEVQLCPEVAAYLDMSPAELANQVPRDMKGVAKRLFCDAYMYLYQSTSMCLYR
ncbi:hypothetical protein INR49_008325 [Caranx melampygus]|nr:hypothetical protein INR49_008325 [Caranx melampygus]